MLEDEKSKVEAAAAQKKPESILTPPSDLGAGTPQQRFQPKSLFTTPRSSSSRNTSNPGTPQTPNMDISDIDSICSEQTSGTSVTPDMSNLTLGHGRGRPRKELVKPTFDDFPIDGTEAEQKRYIKKKRTEIWRYNKLMGADSSQYRQSELNRVKEYQQKKKKEIEGTASDESRDSSAEYKKKLSRKRYIYVKYTSVNVPNLMNDTRS